MLATNLNIFKYFNQSSVDLKRSKKKSANKLKNLKHSSR